MTDARARRKVEAALRESEQKLRLAVDATRMGLWEWDIQTDEVSWDETMLEIWGLTPQTFPRHWRGYLAAVHPEDRARVRAAVLQTLASGAYKTLEHRLLRPDGSVRRVVARATILRGEDGAPRKLLGGTLDVTEEREAEELRREAQKLEAVGQLSAGVAHNFNNLLMGILPNIEMALADASDEQRELLGVAHQSAMHASDLVRDLMLFAGRSRGRRQHAEDVATVVRRTVDICRTSFDRSVSLRVEEPGEPQLVCGDSTQLEQALLNVLLNARDAVMRDEVSAPTVTIRVDPFQRSPELGGEKQDYVRIVISDNGVGMNDATRVRIFEPFFTTKPLGMGTGLGLSTTITIVREHGGSIEVESSPGQGASLSIYLPRAPRDAPTRTPVRRQDVVGGSELILVIDDDETVRNVVSKMLRRGGYRVCVAGDGQEALRLLEGDALRRRLGLVLLDVSMPGLSARRVRAELEVRAPQTPVAYFTGCGLDSPHDADALIEKPVRPAGLLRSVREILDRSSSGSARDRGR